MKYGSNQRKNEAGFTLIEMLIVSTILAFIIGIMGGIVTGIQQSYTQQRVRTDSLNDANAATDMITRLIRMAGNNPNSIAGLQAIDPGTADANGIYRTIHIRSDWRGSTMSSYPNGNTNDPFEDVTFSVSSNKLMKQEPTDSTPVDFLDNVLSIQFVYYDTNNAIIANPATNNASICRVNITVVIQPQYSTPTTFTTSAYVRIR